MQTTEELQATIQAGHDAIAKAKAAAEKAASTKATAAAQAAEELDRREQAEAARIKAREYHWGQWYIHGGGFDQARAAARAESNDARDALAQAVREHPITMAAIRYRAAGESIAHVTDLRDKALHAIGQEETMHHAVNGRENRNDPSREILAAITDAANDTSAEHWDELLAAVDDSTQATDDSWPEKIPTNEQERIIAAETEATFRQRERVEEYDLEHANGQNMRVLHDLDTGQTFSLGESAPAAEEAPKKGKATQA